ncbi:MAG: biotin--[acetyl-CoA-carboxylase] ligase [Endomicrobiia bacterium]
MNTLAKVVNILIENQNKYISGQKIAKMCGISRVAVYKIIKKLLSEGYEIERNKKIGYKLVFYPFIVEEFLKKNFKTVSKVYYFNQVTSTMDVAKELLQKNPQIQNTLIVAQKQTSGKGRLQRKWLSPEGGVYFSLILRPEVLPSEVFFLNYVFSLSVAELLKEQYLINATTKWPNDVVVDNKKICGILIETDAEIDRVNWCIAGVGVNLNIKQTFFDKAKIDATSVMSLTGKKINPNHFFSELFKKIDFYYEMFLKKKYKELTEKWSQFSSTLGKDVEVITPKEIVKGKAICILPQTGALIIKTSSGTKEILSGDCIHLR